MRVRVAVTAIFAVAALVAAVLPAAPLVAQAPSGDPVERVGGSDRIATAVAVSQRFFDGADAVVLSRADLYPDALSAGPLARALDAPILLTPSAFLPDQVMEEIQRLGAERVVIAGEEAAVSESVEATLVEQGLAVQRLGGPDRFETARIIAEHLAEQEFVPEGPTMTVARGRGETPTDGFADALTAGTFGALPELRPTLLTETTFLSTPAATALDAAAAAVVVGGPAAVAPEVEQAVLAIVPQTQRIAGATRGGTSALVAHDVVAQVGPPREVLIATGDHFPDSLVAGALTGRLAAPVLLVPSDLEAGFQQSGPAVPGDFDEHAPEVTQFLLDHCEDIERATVLGLTAAVDPVVEDAVRMLINCTDPDTVGTAGEDGEPDPSGGQDTPPDGAGGGGVDDGGEEDDEPEPGPVVVPDVVGLQQGEALIRIDAATLEGVSGGARHDAAPAGTVLAQDPVGGTEVASGSDVAITISRGPLLQFIPDVLGMDEDQATDTITSAGFTVGVIDAGPSDDHDVGDVNAQLPVGGTEALPGTPVDVTLTTGPINTAPTITTDPAPTILAGQTYTYDAGATDPDGDPLAWVLQAGPRDDDGDDLASIGAADGRLTWATAIDDVGLHDLAMRVEDGRGGIDVQPFTVEVIAPNQPPTAADDAYLTQIDDPLVVDAAAGVLANDTDPDEDPLVVALTTPPQNGRVALTDDGSFTYTPHQPIDPDSSYTDIDLTQLSSVTATASVARGNYPPERLVDGYPGTSWHSPRGNPGSGQVITLTFPHDVSPAALEVTGNRDALAEDGHGVTQIGVRVLDQAGAVLLEIPQFDFSAGTPGDGQDPDAVLDLAAPNGGVAPSGARTVELTVLATEGEAPGLGELTVIGAGPITELAPVVEWEASGTDPEDKVLVMPTVADLDGDGIPEVLSTNGAEQRLTVRDGRDGTVRWTAGAVRGSSTSPVIGDLHPSPGLEVAIPHNSDRIIRIFAADGTLLATPQPHAHAYDANLAIADVDQDGTAELIVPGGGRVSAIGFDGTAFRQEWRTHNRGCGNNNYLTRCIPIVGDPDLDGVTEIIAGNTIYDGRTGAVEREVSTPNSGWTAMGQFDGDPQAEIVIVRAGNIWLFNHDLTLVWGPFDIPGGGRGGAPTVADFDGDGEAEVGAPGKTRYVVVDTDGALLWSAPIRDESSSATASTVFDFDADGVAEVVFRDEQRLYLFDGRDGTVRFSTPVGSGTTVEGPVVADVDADGQAEIVVPASRPRVLPDGTRRQPGLYVFGGLGQNWVRARPLWNQHSYHVTNINADGTIPRVETPNWLDPRLNNFRQNDFPTGEPSGLDRFTYTVSDGTTTATATAHVELTEPQSAPRITCTPSGTATVGLPYTSRICGFDADDDPLSYAIEVVSSDGAAAADGLQVEADTGVLRWTPSPQDLGRTTFAIRVTDITGREAVAIHSIEVTQPAVVPDLTGQPEAGLLGVLEAAGLTLGQQSQAHHPGIPSGSITSQTPPPGTLAAPGDPVDVVVSLGPDPADTDDDGDGFTPNQGDCDDTDADVNPAAFDAPGDGVDADCDGYDGLPAAATGLTIAPVAPVLLQGETRPLHAFLARADGTRNDVTRTATWTSDSPGVLTVDDQGRVTALAPGVARVQAVSAGLGAEITVVVRAPASTDGTPPTARILSPAGGTTIASPTTVTGTVTDPDLLDHVLVLLDATGRLIGEIGRGTSEVTDEPLGTIDPAGLTPGLHTLRLTARDTSGNGVRREIQVWIGAAEPGPPTIQGILLNPVDPQMRPGDTVQMEATAYYSDGSTVVITDNGAWEVGDALIATVSTTGMVTGRRAGATPVTVRFDGASASRAVSVIAPPDTTIPTVAIDQPTGGATIDVATDVVGTADDPNLTDWELALLDDTGNLVAALGAGTTAVVDGVLGTIDPAALADGRYTVRLTATDSAGNWNRRDEPIRVGPPPPGPVTLTDLVINPANIQPAVGATVTPVATAHRSNGSRTDVTGAGTWTIADTSVASVSATGDVTGLAVGTTTLTLTYEGATASRPVQVRALGQPVDTVPPVAAITAPAAGAEVLEPVAVIGTAMDGQLLRWTLDLVDGDEVLTQIASDTVGVADGLLATLDPTLLRNGAGELRLTVTDTAGNTSTARRAVVIDGQVKVGHFSIAMIDLQVGAPGLPLEVVRRYDTRDDGLGDFGYGWRLDLTDIDVNSSGVQGRDWALVPGRSSFRLQPTVSHTITIRLPDGRIETFAAEPSPATSALVPPTTVQMGYRPVDPTLGTLRPTGNRNVIVARGGGTDVELLDDITFRVWNPRGFIYTAANGVRIRFDEAGEIQSYTDTNGNRITITPDGLRHSAGLDVDFTRDTLGRVTAITDPEGAQQTYAYDAAGDLVSHTDAEGHTTTYRYTGAHDLVEVIDPLDRPVQRHEYDAAGRLVAIIDGTGRRTEITHDAAADTEIVTGPSGGQRILQHDARGNVVREVDERGNETLREFDAADNMTRLTDAAGGVMSFTYDDQRNQTSRTHATGAVEQFTYDRFGNVTRWEDAEGQVWTYDRDAAGNLLAEVRPDGSEVRHTYDSAGSRVTTTDGEGNATLMEHDAAGNPIALTTPSGAVIESTYNRRGEPTGVQMGTAVPAITGVPGVSWERDRNGQVTRVVGADGTETQTTYDGARQITGIEGPLGQVVTMEYDDAGRRSAHTLPDGTTIPTTYDAAGRAQTISNVDGSLSPVTYDATGNVTSVGLPAPPGAGPAAFAQAGGGALGTITYDELNRPEEVTDEGGGTGSLAFDAAGRMTSVQPAGGDGLALGYDDLNRVVTETDALGRTTTITYDERGNTTSLTHPDGAVERWTYDADDNVTSHTDGLGHTTTYAYDVDGWLVTITDPLGGVTTYQRNSMGLITAVTDAEGRVTRMRYDTSGNATQIIFPDGRIETRTFDALGRAVRRQLGAFDVRWAYDEMGRLTEIAFGDGRVATITHDRQGNPIEVTDDGQTWRYEWDDRGRLEAAISPDGTTVSYTNDAEGVASVTTASGTTEYVAEEGGRITQVVDPTGTFDLTHDAVGNLLTVTAPNGTVEERTYDDRDRVTGITVTGPGGTVLQHAYTYDAAGRLTEADEGDRVVTYAYDDLGRLVQEAVASGGGTRTTAYTYDAVGNRLTVDDSVDGLTTATFNASDQLVAVSGPDGDTTFTHDVAGRMLMTDGPGGTDLRSWDAADRLRLITGDTQQVRLDYDPQGNLVRRRVDGVEERFVIDVARRHDGPIERITSGGTERTVATGRPLAVSGPAGVQVLHGDQLGSVRVATGPDATVVGRQDFSSFGVRRSPTGAALSYGFAGERNSAPGMVFLRSRHLDPVLGRFVSSDRFPIDEMEPRSRNAFAYVWNDPVNLIDPTGQSPLAGALNALAITSVVLGAAIAAGQFASVLLDRSEPVLWSGPTYFISPSLKGSPFGFSIGFTLLRAERDGLRTDGVHLVFAFGKTWDALTALADRRRGGNPREVTDERDNSNEWDILGDFLGFNPIPFPLGYSQGEAKQQSVAFQGGPTGIQPQALRGGYLNLGFTLGGGLPFWAAFSSHLGSTDNTVGGSITVQGFSYGYTRPSFAQSMTGGFSASYQAGFSINITPGSWIDQPIPDR